MPGRHTIGGNRPDRVKACHEAHHPSAPAEPEGSKLELVELKKATLLAIAQETGVEVRESMTKTQIADIIEAGV